jgi:hypothetical protein
MKNAAYGSFQQEKLYLQKGRTAFGVELKKIHLTVITYVTGLVLFCAWLLFLNLVLFYHRSFTVMTGIFGFGLSLAAFNRNSCMLDKPLGGACCAALAIGSIFGIFCYDAYGYLANLYGNARTYQNVVVSEPAAKVADAGNMIFAAEAYVDQNKAAGYAAADGRRYCVAPLRDLVKTTHVEFWAVGYDCCKWTGGFKCDASAETGARGGVVVFDNPGIFTTSNRDYYDLARKKAEALSQPPLVSAKKPLYVRWVMNGNLNKLRNENQWRTALFIIASTLLYAGVSFPFAYRFCSTIYSEWYH